MAACSVRLVGRGFVAEKYLTLSCPPANSAVHTEGCGTSPTRTHNQADASSRSVGSQCKVFVVSNVGERNDALRPSCLGGRDAARQGIRVVSEHNVVACRVGIPGTGARSAEQWICVTGKGGSQVQERAGEHSQALQHACCAGY